MNSITLLKIANAQSAGRQLGEGIKALGRAAKKSIGQSAEFGEGVAKSFGVNKAIGRVAGAGALVAGAAGAGKAGKDYVDERIARRRMMRGY